MEIRQGANAISTALLDYFFGWRWLLPFVPGQRLWLSGFDEAEQAFWHKAVASADWLQEPAQAQGWIFELGNALSGEVEGAMSSLPDAVQWVACAGTGEAVCRLRRHLSCDFSEIREFGLLPATNSRLVVPLAEPCHAVSALALHRPGRWTAQLGVRLVAILAQFGVYFPLRRRVLLIASRAHLFSPIGALQAGVPINLSGEVRNYALYLGTPDDNRKTVALPLGNAVPGLLIKMGGSTQARQALRNEAAALAFIAGLSPQPSFARESVSGTGKGGGHAGDASQSGPPSDSSFTGRVPRMLGLVENEHCVALYQEYRPRLKVRPAVLEEAVIEFLAQLATIDQRSRPLHEVLGEMTAAVSLCEWAGDEKSAGCSIWRWLCRRADEGAEVCEHRSHGDFAPWNCAWTAQGFFVFDWEESRPLALAFGDAFYFALAPTLHVAGKKDYSHIQAKALALAGQVAKRDAGMEADVKVQYGLWLLEKQATHAGYAGFIEQLAKEFVACPND